ncbi:MAG: trypsin-like peptidase domain-containing protein [Nitrospirota bacterium]|nr:MAG: trypsin-like peptidase domain-containing protein [Nitrospirota bacterium]
MRKLAIAGCIISITVLLLSAHSGALTQEELSNIKVFETSSPSVVNITTTTLVRDLFSVYPKDGAGSGTIIKKEGFVLTNYHVVKDAKKIQVTLTNGDKYEAELVGASAENDLAVIKIKSDKEFIPLVFGDSDALVVGQKVYAIGNPFGLNSTLTTGIISAVGRPLTSQGGLVIENVVQTDAPINPGNSGGPLIDSGGKMIGINTAIFSPSGGSVGIGFAIPVNTAKGIIDDLISFGKVRRPSLGVTGVPLWEEFASSFGLPLTKGILVSTVEKGGPADKAGLRGGSERVRVSGTTIYIGGDIITEIAGVKVTSTEDIRRSLSDKKDGDLIDVKVFRKGEFKILKIRVKLKT